LLFLAVVYANIRVINDLYWPDSNMHAQTDHPPSSGPIQERSETCAKARLSRYYRHAEAAVPEVELAVKIRFVLSRAAISSAGA